VSVPRSPCAVAKSSRHPDVVALNYFGARSCPGGKLVGTLQAHAMLSLIPLRAKTAKAVCKVFDASYLLQMMRDA
jgi:hypothetical protein